MNGVAGPRVLEQSLKLRAVAILAAGAISENAVEGDRGQLPGGG